MAAIDLFKRFRLTIAALAYTVWSGGATPSTDPRIRAGAGAASASEPNGSLWLRTDGPSQTRVGSAWYKLSSLLYAAVAASTAITGATETATLFSPQFSVPAGALEAGSVLRIRAQGIHTATTDAETHTIALKLGSITIASVAAVDPANDDMFYFDAIVVIRTAGASGTLVATGTLMAAAATAAGDAAPFLLASTAIDTTAAHIVGVEIDRQASATDGDSARLDILVVERLA